MHRERGSISADGVVLVIPCYNEAARLRSAAFVEALHEQPTLRLVFVDDGSTDATRAVLDRLASEGNGRVDVLALPTNQGKAEAVRQGLLQAIRNGACYVGYWDADLATPFEALPDFLRVFELLPDIEIVLGSRVRLLGRDIERTVTRHYTGRVFATAASMVLGIPVYDTQCGAKLFRNSSRLARILDHPFNTRWIFDVELLARYLDDRAGTPPETSPSRNRLYELALRNWVDEPGSKVRAKDGIRAAVDLVRIHRLRRRA